MCSTTIKSKLFKISLQHACIHKIYICCILGEDGVAGDRGSKGDTGPPGPPGDDTVYMLNNVSDAVVGRSLLWHKITCCGYTVQ